MKSKLISPFTIVFCMLALSNCSPQYQNHGNKVEDEQLSEIIPGQTSVNEAKLILGPPTNVGDFNSRNLYYVFQSTKRKAFFDPEIVSRRVVRLGYNDDEIIQEVKIFTEKEGKVIDVVERESPTAGKDLTVIQQMMGNLGKFNKPDQ